MVGLTELARAGTPLDDHSIDHLHRLVASWAPLADLSFGDLLLYAPCVAGFDPSLIAPSGGDVVAGAGVAPGGRSGGDFVVLAHTRGTTGPTVHLVDPVGTLVESRAMAWLRAAIRDGEAGEAEIAEFGERSGVGDDPLVQEQGSLALRDRRRLADFVPVRCGSAPVAVLAREAAPAPIRHENPLETIYRGLYTRFAEMIGVGAFPYERMERVGEFREPRVGDGVMVFDREGRISYASPNARSAVHRLGVLRPIPGCRLDELKLDDTVIRRSFFRRRSTVAEFTAGAGIVVVMRAYPLVSGGRVTGAMALLRDVSELRQHDRLLLSKDATIREIHHRVKNNLQTVSSLLQLQARRLGGAEAKAAVESSVRRISSIAMVHEYLALDTASDVDFDEIVGPLVRLVSDGLAPAEGRLEIGVEGTVGEVDGETAMPLAVVLVELVQNALQHAGPPTGPAQRVEVRFTRSAEALAMCVSDDGPGVPEGFSLDRDAGLGLTIVRTFVVHDLGGSITIKPSSLDRPRGTVIEVSVPATSPAEGE